MKPAAWTLSLALVAAVGWTGEGVAQGAKISFAPVGTKATLHVTIQVTGTGREGFRSGAYDSLRWNVRHTVQFETTLEALDPIADTSSGNRAALAATDSAAKDVLGDDAETVQEKWDEKMDACDGNETCEMRVTAAMMGDPAYRKLILKVQARGGEVLGQAAAINVTPRYQIWAYRIGPDVPPPTVKGTASLERRNKMFGMVSTDGSPKSDGTSGWSRTGPLPPDAMPGHGGQLVVDGQTGGYRIVVPAELVLPADECSGDGDVCTPTGDELTVPLIDGKPAHGDYFESDLAATGKVVSRVSPKASGTLSFSPVLDGDGSIKVTVEWSFQPKGASK